jgi:hypothetical protein
MRAPSDWTLIECDCGRKRRVPPGPWLRDRRLAAGKTSDEVGALAGYSGGLVRKVERGVLMAPARLVKVVQALAAPAA